MADPQIRFIDPSAAGDADVIRRKMTAARKEAMRLFEIPDTTVIGDDVRRAKLVKSADDVVLTTVELAALSEVIPAGVIRTVVVFFSGVKKTPEGDTKVVPGTAGNFAPSPVGYLDPTTVGLKRNFYLPPRITSVIPERLDQFGFGLPEQRAEDVASRAAREQRDTDERQAIRRAALRGESIDVVRDVAEGRGGITRAGYIFATGAAGDTAALRAEAAAEVERRAREGSPLTRLVEAAAADHVAAIRWIRAGEAVRVADRLVAATELGLAVFAGLGSMDAVQAAMPPDP